MVLIGKTILFAAFCICAAANVAAQGARTPACGLRTATEKSLEMQGMVNVAGYDSTILVSMMYGRADNFTGKVLYSDLDAAYLHPNAARALARAQKFLRESRPELTLKVYDAARPMSVQREMWKAVAGTPKNIYVSNPARGGGLHNYGLAVDVTLAYHNGDTIPMGTRIDNMTALAHIDNEERLVLDGRLSREAVRNRRLLRGVMRRAGFRALRSEWWHFNYASRGYARKNHKVLR